MAISGVGSASAYSNTALLGAQSNRSSELESQSSGEVQKQADTSKSSDKNPQTRLPDGPSQPSLAYQVFQSHSGGLGPMRSSPVKMSDADKQRFNGSEDSGMSERQRSQIEATRSLGGSVAEMGSNIDRAEIRANMEASRAARTPDGPAGSADHLFKNTREPTAPTAPTSPNAVESGNSKSMDKQEHFARVVRRDVLNGTGMASGGGRPKGSVLDMLV